MSRIIFGILCHNSADHVQDQFQLLQGPGVRFIYHADAKAPPRLKSLLATLAARHPNVVVLDAVLCSWAGFSLTQVMLNIIQQAAAEDWDHLVFLSEQHVPLQSFEVLSAGLAPDCNYLHSRPYRQATGVPQADVLHRVSQLYRELPGVGAFGTGGAAPPDDFLDFLCYGTQWIILCRATCRALAACASLPYLERFRHALLSDETAVPSWVNGLGTPGVTNIPRIPTVVAFPGNNGDAGTAFGDRLFFDSRDQGFLFIRKRGEALSPAVTAYLEEAHPLSARPAPIALPDKADDGFNQPLAVEALTRILNEKCARSGFKLLPQPGWAKGPVLQLRAAYASLKPPFFVFVLSQNLRHFKVMAVAHAPSNGFKEGQIGPYRTSAVRARVHDVAFQHEIHLGAGQGDGFFEVKNADDLDSLAKLTADYVTKTAILGLKA